MSLKELGPYRIERSLGRGGMGTVYLGTNRETGQIAALKILSPALASDDNFRDRFSTEVETLKKLRHPNIVELFGYGEHEGQLFYAMEMVDGKTLQEEIQARHHFSWREVARYGVEICAALKHAHDRGIIHRDLKPANLLRDEEDHIKLSDFGIAKLYGASHLTAEGGVLGTADYMSPEQAEGLAVTTRSDLYSLGSVLYALLARRPPFASKTIPEVIHALRYHEAPPVTRLAPDTPREFEELIAQLLEKDPKKRVATALAVSNRLKAMIHALNKDPSEFEVAGDPGEPLDLEAAGNDPTALIGEDSGAVTSNHSDATIAAPPTPDKSGDELKLADEEPPRATHFTPVTPRQLDSPRDEESEGRVTWLLRIAALIVGIVAIVGAVWFAMRPASAEKLYGRIMAAADKDDIEQLLGVDRDVAEFLARFSTDPRAMEVQQVSDAIELHKTQRRLERRTRRAATNNPVTDPVECAYLEAIAVEATNPAAAARQLRAILDVFSDDDQLSADARRCLQLAADQLPELERRAGEQNQNTLAAIRRQIDRAEQLRPESPEHADRILRGIVELYHDQPWAGEVLSEISGER